MASLPLLALLLAQAAAPSAAQPGWRPLGQSGNGRESFYDPASVVRAGAVTRVSVRFVEATGHVVSTVELRCANYDGRVAGMTTYDANGTQTGRNEMATPFRAILAGSFVETLAREVCGAAQAPASPQ